MSKLLKIISTPKTSNLKDEKAKTFKEISNFMTQLNSVNFGGLIDLKSEKESMTHYDVDTVANSHCKKINLLKRITNKRIKSHSVMEQDRPEETVSINSKDEALMQSEVKRIKKKNKLMNRSVQRPNDQKGSSLFDVNNSSKSRVRINTKHQPIGSAYSSQAGSMLSYSKNVAPRVYDIHSNDKAILQKDRGKTRSPQLNANIHQEAQPKHKRKITQANKDMQSLLGLMAECGKEDSIVKDLCKTGIKYHKTYYEQCKQITNDCNNIQNYVMQQMIKYKQFNNFKRRKSNKF